jgi:SIR2-like protein
MSRPVLDSHFAALVPILAEGRVVPFLGAGANLAGRAPGTRWSPSGHEIPSGAELAEHLGARAGLATPERNLPRVAQYAEARLGRGEVEYQVREAVDCELSRKPVHDFLAGLPRRLRSARERHPDLRIKHPNLLIVTTNYDNLLECALDEANEPFDVVTYMADGEFAGRFLHFHHGEPDPYPILRPNEYADVSPDERTVVLKLHGAIDRALAERDSIVITEDDYINYLTITEASGMLPVTLAEKLRSSHLLFLGYGLADWNLRVVLRRIWGPQGVRFASWAVQLDPDPVETELWTKRHVGISEAELGTYVAQLSDRLALHLRERPPLDEGLAAVS